MKKVLVSCTVALLIVLISLPASAVTRLDLREEPKTTGSGSSSRVDMNAIAQQYQPTYDTNYAVRHWTTRLELKQYVDPSLRMLSEVTIDYHYKMPFVVVQNRSQTYYGQSLVVHTLTSNEERTDDQWTYFYNLQFRWKWADAPGYSYNYCYGYNPNTRVERFTARAPK